MDSFIKPISFDAKFGDKISHSSVRRVKFLLNISKAKLMSVPRSTKIYKDLRLVVWSKIFCEDYLIPGWF